MPVDRQPLLSADQVEVRAADTTLVHEASVQILPGEVVVLLGPNGAGKSSLLRALVGITPVEASIQLGADRLDNLSIQERARRVSYLPQGRETAWPNRVFDIVALGRFAQGVALGRLTDADHQAVTQAITACDLQTLQDRRVDTLSGGEMARVHCARLYAANTPLLVADEPTAGLDPLQQHRITQLFASYAGDTKAVLLVLHDINLALRYGTRLLWMKEGQIVADLSPDAVTADLVTKVYQVEAEEVNTTLHNTKQFMTGLPT